MQPDIILIHKNKQIISLESDNDFPPFIRLIHYSLTWHHHFDPYFVNESLLFDLFDQSSTLQYAVQRKHTSSCCGNYQLIVVTSPPLWICV